jgi:septal ring factor EnvC (AmiA/AmiB activator)
MADLSPSIFIERIKGVLIASGFILSLLGWAFSLGAASARVDKIEGLSADLAQSDKEQNKDINEVQNQLVRLETSAEGMHQTLREIKDEIIRLREAKGT